MRTRPISALRLCAIAATALLPLLAGSAAAQSTSPRPLQRATDEHLALLMTRAYDKLDQAADEARAKNLPLSDGQPLLSAIYRGVAGCACGNQLNDELWLVRKQRLDEWIGRKPNSTTARLARAAFPVRYAWLARGDGYAREVSPEAWKIFRERTEEGRKALEALDRGTKQDAGWYELMLDVALYQGWPRDKYDAMFREAVAKYPYYTPFYFSHATFYSPRWYGSVEDGWRVIEDAVHRTRSRWGEIMYTRLNWTATDPEMFRSGRTVWPRMKTGFEQLVKEYPDAWNVNNFGKFACLASDYSTLSGLLPKIGDALIAEAWGTDIGFYHGCRAIAAKLHGK